MRTLLTVLLLSAAALAEPPTFAFIHGRWVAIPHPQIINSRGGSGTAPFTTTTANPSSTGVLRCANNEACVSARNAANGANISITLDSTDAWTFGTGAGGNASLGTLTLNGATSGAITVTPPAVAGSNTMTLPAATDTFVGKATTDTLTNKTYDTAGTGNVFKINGTAISAVSGTGAVCLASGSACAGGAASTVYLSPTRDDGGAFGNTTNNTVRVLGVYIPSSVTASNIVIQLQAASGANLSSVGLYDSSGNKVCTTTASSTTFNTTGFLTVACSEGSVTFGPGKFYFATTSVASTMRVQAGSSNLTFRTATDSATGSSSGALPASITPPADAVGDGGVIFGFK